MAADYEELVCPVCGTATNGSGAKFASIRALCLHLAGKAIGYAGGHPDWIESHIPEANLEFGNINPLGSQIRFYVEEAIEAPTGELKEPDGADQLFIEKLELEITPSNEGERSALELEKYLKAYSLIWDIENHLHRFASLTLGPKHDHGLWLAFPRDLQHDCLERFNHDGKRASLDCYIHLQEFSGIVKENKSDFETAFDGTRANYKDPQSFFHNNLHEVNQIRNDVMHPLKRLTPSSESLTKLEEFAEFIREFTDCE